MGTSGRSHRGRGVRGAKVDADPGHMVLRAGAAGVRESGGHGKSGGWLCRRGRTARTDMRPRRSPSPVGQGQQGANFSARARPSAASPDGSPGANVGKGACQLRLVTSSVGQGGRIRMQRRSPQGHDPRSRGRQGGKVGGIFEARVSRPAQSQRLHAAPPALDVPRLRPYPYRLPCDRSPRCSPIPMR